MCIARKPFYVRGQTGSLESLRRSESSTRGVSCLRDCSLFKGTAFRCYLSSFFSCFFPFLHPPPPFVHLEAPTNFPSFKTILGRPLRHPTLFLPSRTRDPQVSFSFDPSSSTLRKEKGEREKERKEKGSRLKVNLRGENIARFKDRSARSFSSPRSRPTLPQYFLV